jgi:hypothetical protein
MNGRAHPISPNVRGIDSHINENSPGFNGKTPTAQKTGDLSTPGFQNLRKIRDNPRIKRSPPPAQLAGRFSPFS